MRPNLSVYIITLLFSVNIIKADKVQFYKSHEEEEYEKIGSIIGPDGLVLFSSKKTNKDKDKNTNKVENEKVKNTIKEPKKIKEINSTNNSIKNTSKNLFDSSIEYLANYPIIHVDPKNNLLITDWFYEKNFSNNLVRIELKIEGDDLNINSFIKEDKNNSQNSLIINKKDLAEKIRIDIVKFFHRDKIIN